MKKVLPKFRTEDAEREFWASHDSVGYIDWRKGKRVTLPNLKPSSQTISIRLPKPMLDRLKLLANKRDVPYSIAPEDVRRRAPQGRVQVLIAFSALSA